MNTRSKGSTKNKDWLFKDFVGGQLDLGGEGERSLGEVLLSLDFSKGLLVKLSLGESSSDSSSESRSEFSRKGLSGVVGLVGLVELSDRLGALEGCFKITSLLLDKNGESSSDSLSYDLGGLDFDKNGRTLILASLEATALDTWLTLRAASSLLSSLRDSSSSAIVLALRLLALNCLGSINFIKVVSPPSWRTRYPALSTFHCHNL